MNFPGVGGRFNFLILGFSLLALTFLHGTSQEVFAHSTSTNSAAAVPGEYLVHYRTDRFSSTEMAQLLTRQNIRIKRNGRHAPFYICEGNSLQEIRHKLLLHKEVVVEPNYICRIPEGTYPKSTSPGAHPNPPVRRQSQTSDPLLPSQQWNYYRIGADLASRLPPTAPAIAVLDTGVAADHPDLLGKVIKGPDFVQEDGDPTDDSGHGTHVAGIAAAISNNKIGIAGISAKSRIFAVKILNSEGWGTYSDLIDGIYAAAKRKDVKVINLSLGGPHSVNLEQAIDYARNVQGKVIVAAAGNDGTSDGFDSYPAAYPGVIAVASSDFNDERSSFSNYGSWVDVAAPGNEILSTVPRRLFGVDYESFQGTSMATPHVAGVVARIWAQDPSLSVDQVESRLLTTADPLPSSWPSGTTFGRVNLFRALGGSSDSSRLVIGNFFNAVTGKPVLGAKFSASAGADPVASDIVPADGNAYVLVDAPGTYTFKVGSPGFIPFRTPPLEVSTENIYLGNIPIVPATTGWQLAMSWEDQTDFDLFLAFPEEQPKRWIIGNRNLDAAYPHLRPRLTEGSLRSSPYVSWNRDSHDPSSQEAIPIESISMRQISPGIFQLAAYNWSVTGNFKTANARVFVYRSNFLKKEVRAVNGSGTGSEGWWVIGTLQGSRFIEQNHFTDELPFASGGVEKAGAFQIPVDPLHFPSPQNLSPSSEDEEKPVLHYF